MGGGCPVPSSSLENSLQMPGAGSQMPEPAGGRVDAKVGFSRARRSMDHRLDLEAARLEVEKLQADLDTAERNLHESAQKGLALLEAKADLEEQNEVLEGELEKLRSERDGLKTALSKATHEKKETINRDLDAENDLLREKNQAEDNFTSRIVILESENRSMRSQAERTAHDLMKLQEAVKLAADDNEQLKRSHEKMHVELLEHRQQEKLMSSENEVMHSDNVHLRKHIAVLELRTKEFEGLKFESRKLAEDRDLLQCELEESRRLMDIVKQQSEEAWKTLENERELRRTLQRQLHDQTDERDRWTRMASLRMEVDEDGEFDGAGFVPEGPMEPKSLFDELQTSSPHDRQVDVTDEQLALQRQRLEQIQKIIGALDLLASSESPLAQLQAQVTAATAEIHSLCSSDTEPAVNTDRSVFLEDIQSQLTKRSSRQAALEAEVNGLHGTVEAICELLIEKQLSLNSCYDSLRSLRGSLSSSSSPSSNGGSGNEPSGPSQDGSSSPSQTSPRRSNKLEEEIRARINHPGVRIPEIVNIDVAADSDMLMRR
ncbi:hypothetical protein BV898_01861 [Hypsibius exemplaris]|uniref:Uncharacterized protein n=1 Tax=Hypsibius exemplaris TaxID=2072580 RepID=A0A1W0XAH5_HYPEX|nr:hypothetical protein BV898_01861 [Hypsibius exemplaris]